MDGIVFGWSRSGFVYFLSVFNVLPFFDLRPTEVAIAFFVQIPIDRIWKTRHRPMEYRSLQHFFGGSGRGPDLIYGTSPWYFYVNNLVLNFYILPLALVSLPALGVTYIIDCKRLGLVSSMSSQSSPFTVLGLRLALLY